MAGSGHKLDGFSPSLLEYSASARAATSDRGSASVIAMRSRAAGHLGLGDADAVLGVGCGADVGEQQVLDAGRHGPHGEVRLRGSLHLDQASEVGVELDSAGEIVERVQV